MTDRVRDTAALSAHVQQILGSAYTLERELGGGGMSRVFVAHDHALARRVVVKVLPPEMAAAVNAERFRREIQLAAGLQHPHIVPVLSAGSAKTSAGEVLYYTMPFVEGESLRELLSRHRELAIPEAIRLLREIADALAYAHDRGLVHRDIKPENILLTTGHALVADFGIARALNAATGIGSLTSVGVAVGTPAYMAPEQAAADPLTDHRADLYALGVVAYELLAGHAPFHGMAPQQMLAAHALTQPEHVTSRRPAVPAALGALVMQLLEKRAADRPQSAHDVMRALDALVSQPTGAPSSVMPTPASPARRTMSRRFATLGVALVVLGAAAAAVLRFGSPAPPPALDANLIAVAPFRVTGDASLAYLREGMLDLLAARLTGEGGPRAGDPRTLLSGWRRRAGSNDTDLPERDALDLAKELGASQLLLGSVVATPARIVLHANLVTVPTGAVRATADAEGPADSLSALVDRLAADLLARGAGQTERLTGATARPSLPVLRLYLDGMANTRKGKYPEAQRSLSRALEMDSTFIPAALALVAIHGYNPIDNSRAMQLVMRVHPSLNERDRALIELRRRFVNNESQARVLEAATQHVTVSPDRAEAWTDLGGQLYHFASLTGLTDFRVRARAAYARAMELDPDFATAVYGLIEVAADMGDTTIVRELWPRHQRLASDALEFETLRWKVAHALADSSTVRAMLANIQSLPPRDLLRILEGMMVSGVGLEDAPAFVRELGARAVEDYDIERGALAAGSFLLNGGSDEAPPPRFVDETPPLGRHFAKVEDALSWDGDTTSALQGVRALATYALGSSETRGFPRDYGACYLAMWHLNRGDSAAARPFLSRARELRPRGSGEDPQSYERLCYLTVDALLEHLRGDRSGAALTRLDSLLVMGYEGAQVFNLIAARLHEARGDIQAALAAVRRRANHGRDGPLALSTMLREEGRLAALAGDVEGAIRAYSHFLALRPNPAPRLRADMERVRAARAQLVATRSR
ncbi:MAG TPA: serine/threonine-protein kinase [Gemmatimonadaceae bacterium]